MFACGAVPHSSRFQPSGCTQCLTALQRQFSSSNQTTAANSAKLEYWIILKLLIKVMHINKYNKASFLDRFGWMQRISVGHLVGPHGLRQQNAY